MHMRHTICIAHTEFIAFIASMDGTTKSMGLIHSRVRNPIYLTDLGPPHLRGSPHDSDLVAAHPHHGASQLAFLLLQLAQAAKPPRLLLLLLLRC